MTFPRFPGQGVAEASFKLLCLMPEPTVTHKPSFSAPTLISGTKTTKQPCASKGPGVQVCVELEPIFFLLLILKFLSGTPKGLPFFLLLKYTLFFSLFILSFSYSEMLSLFYKLLFGSECSLNQSFMYIIKTAKF